MTEPQPEPSDWLPSSNWHQPLKQILAYGMEVILQVNDASLEFDTHNTFYTTAAHSARTSVPQDDLHYYTSHPDRISVAAVAIWSYLIPQLYIEYAQFKLSLDQQRKEHGCDTMTQIQKTLTRCFWGNIVCGLCYYGVSASCVGYMTSSTPSGLAGDDTTTEIRNNGGGGLDRRASDIVTGLSRLFAGVISLILSIKLCQWLGVYRSIAVDSQRRYHSRVLVSSENHGNTDTFYYYKYKSLRELRFDFTVRLQYILIAPYCFHLYFSCDTDDHPAHVMRKANVQGVVYGTLLGLFFIMVVNKTRSNPTLKTYYKPYIASFLALLLVFVSVLCIGLGVYFIERVWRETSHEPTAVTIPTITFWFGCVWLGIVCVGTHAAAVYMSQLERKQSIPERYNSLVFQEKAPGLKSAQQQIQQLLHQEKTHTSVSNDWNGTNEEDATISYLSLLMTHIGFGDKMNGDAGLMNSPEISSLSTTSSLPSRLFRLGRRAHTIVWFTASILFWFMTIVNMGATYQQNIVRSNLNIAFEKLYPPTYHTGQMCAWDAKSPKGKIKTFDSPEAAHEAGYTVAHCGACGACSNWNDLKLQWTTRTFLAKVARRCCQKSILGSREATKECNIETIGFTPKCAECWTTDELCARNNCFFIFLQSTMTNAVTDFRVGFNDITAATCDEALCGPEFGPCVGAIRRRMNIHSDIERPSSQQCHLVQEDWSAIFNSP